MLGGGSNEEDRAGGGGRGDETKGEQGSSLEQDNYSTAGRAHERDLTCGIGSRSFVSSGKEKRPTST